MKRTVPRSARPSMARCGVWPCWWLLLGPLAGEAALVRGGARAALGAGGTEAPGAPAPAGDPALSLAPSQVGGDLPPHFRPHAGGPPDVVRFGMHCRAVLNIDIKKGTFTADVVVMLRWSDGRAAALVREVGQKMVTLATSDAKSRIWLPDVTITNRDVHGSDLISSTVEMNSSGVVTKVDRLLARMQDEFEVDFFPFDTQVLHIELGSASYMREELAFSPMDDPELTGVKEGLMHASDFTLVGVNASVVETMDAGLRKSRAVIGISLERRSGPYIQSIIMPELLVLFISFSVFWLPLLGPFAMPRVGTALISFLALTTLGLRTNEMLPTRGGLAWIDLFENVCQTLMFCTVAFNVFVLVVYHSFKETAFATRIDHELRVLCPLLATISCGICFWERDGSRLWLVVIIANNVITGVSLAYAAWTFWRLQKALEDPDDEGTGVKA